MGAPTIIAIALGVAMDAVAVAAAKGFSAPAVRLRDALLVGLFFGGFQALMPLVGYWVGDLIGATVAAWDHWIAFVVLVSLGLRMLKEARSAQKSDDNERGAAAQPRADVFRPGLLAPLAVATSIDALVIGITLPMIGAPFATTIAAMGLTTAVLSVAGVYAGRQLGVWLGPRLDVVGGLILIGLGVKVLVEHLSA